MMNETQPIIPALKNKFGDSSILAEQNTVDGTPCIWVGTKNIKGILSYLKNEIPESFKMLYDLTVIDERRRINRNGQPASEIGRAHV
jgi:NADH-quinone oxidoreductase subunit C/D